VIGDGGDLTTPAEQGQGVDPRSSDVTYGDIVRAFPEPRIVCRSVQIYGPLINGRRTRLVITEDLDPRFVKLVITEPEPNTKGYRSATFLADAVAFEGLEAAFSRTGGGIRIPAPRGEAADRLELVADDVRRAARAIDQARFAGESFEDAVVRLRTVAINQSPPRFPTERQIQDAARAVPTLDPEPADLRTLRPRGYEGPD
jgi:hypothetical protein